MKAPSTSFMRAGYSPRSRRASNSRGFIRPMKSPRRAIRSGATASIDRRVFFVLSKLLAFFTQPSNLIVSLGLVGLVLTRTRFARAGWRLAGGSLVLVGLIGFLPLGRALSIPLENRFPRGDPTGAPPAGIIVLGGAVSANKVATRGEVGVNEAAERVIAVPALAKRYPAARIVYSGGDAGLFVHHGSEADV